MRGSLVLLTCAALAWPSLLCAQERPRGAELSALLGGRKPTPDGELHELSERLQALQRSTDGPALRSALAEVRAALVRARAAATAGDAAALAAAKQRAWAALSLASRQRALFEVRRATALAQRRAARARDTLERETRALQQAQARAEQEGTP